MSVAQRFEDAAGHQHVSRRSTAYWRKHNGAFPFQCTTDCMKRIKIRPEDVEANSEGHVLRCPVGETVFWGFEKKSDLVLFNQLYPEANWG